MGIEKIRGRKENREKMKQTLEQLKEALKDPEYRQGWIANIAMSQIDNERWYREEQNKVGKYLNRQDRHIIANKAAEDFVNLLIS